MIKLIRDNILSRMQSTLGNSYSQLSFVETTSKNKAQTSNNKFSVVPDGAIEAAGTLGSTTLDHRFIFTLTNGCLTVDKSLNDNRKIETGVELQIKALDIYKDLQKNMTLVHNQIKIINNFSMDSVEFEENVAILKFSINIKYKI